jgi:hypothetical protein
MKQLARLGILIGAFIVAAIVYGVWKQLDREMGGGFLSAFIRGIVVFGFLGWVWHATKNLAGKDN